MSILPSCTKNVSQRRSRWKDEHRNFAIALRARSKSAKIQTALLFLYVSIRSYFLCSHIMPLAMIYLSELYHITLLSSIFSISIFSRSKTSGLCTNVPQVGGFSCQMIFFVGEFFILSPIQLSSVCKSLNRISQISSLTNGVWAAYAARQRFKRYVSSRSMSMNAAFSCHSSVLIKFQGYNARNSVHGLPTRWFRHRPSQQKILPVHRCRSVRPSLFPAQYAGSHLCAGRR